MSSAGATLPAEQPADEWLLRILLTDGLIDAAAADAARTTVGVCASTALLRRGLIEVRALGEAVRKHYDIELREPAAGSLEKMAISLVPEKMCRKHRLVPLKVDGERIHVLMANPLDATALEDVALASGRRPAPYFGLAERIEELIMEAYSSDAVVFDLLKKLPEETHVQCLTEEAPKEEGSISEAQGAPLIRLANALIAQAILMQASDVHIEHEESATVVRYRVDGDLRSVMKLPKYIGEGPLVSRIKIMANLDVADRRRPQDGRAKLLVGSQEIGLRISTIPTAFGEKAVLRILDSRQAELPLDRLGFSAKVVARMEKLAHWGQGLMLMTGPTGSGKTSTLYSILNRLKSSDINVVTVEDPIEYRLSGINQTQVNEKAGLTFATVLRSVLRQDPDVVLVGEIRDRETADIAFQAALTGHMVFSTLHTNDALSTISRLLDMKVERFKLAPALIGVVSQRLVRRLCPACRVREPAPPPIAEMLVKHGFPAYSFKGQGCQDCSFSGLKGRTTLVELLDLSEQAARDMINAGASAAAFRDEALKRGWLLTMAEDALAHVAQGDVPLEEAAALMEAPAAEAVSVAAAVLSLPTAAAPRVLIVDDNADNRQLARDTLQAEGYSFIEAADGGAAIEKIEKEKPDLVVLDVMMPVIDGLAVLKRLRGEMKLPSLPVLIVTALGDADSQALAIELGADDYLAKPFNPRVLRARVQALLRRRELRSAR